MIIVCGPDNAGKTTLVEHLKEKYKLDQVPKFHSLPPFEHANEWYKWLVDTLIGETDNLIADRFYVEEFVYGPVMRGEICISQSQVEFVDKLIIKANIMIIHADPGYDTIEKSFSEREQYPDISQIQEIRQGFFNVLRVYPFNRVSVIRFNYTQDPSYRYVDSMVEMYLNHTRKEK